jgi:PAS domain S-box-containing protein
MRVHPQALEMTCVASLKTCVPMKEFSSRRLAGQYAAITALVVGATLVRLPAEGILEGRAPYGLYFPIITLVAWFFGVGPTIFASVMSLAIAWYCFVPPQLVLRKAAAESASAIIFVMTAGALVALARVAAAARTSQAQLAAIVTHSDDAIVTKDLDGTIRTWNAGAQRIFGYAPQEIVGKPIWTLIPPDRRGEEEDILSRLRRGDRISHYETIRVSKTGNPLDVSLTISPLKNSSGRIVGVSKIARDISERRRAERALAEQREWFRVTLASIGDAVITSDRSGKVSFLNPVAERLTGYSLEQALGKPLGEVFRIVNESTREPIDSPAEKVLRSGAIIGLANHTALIAKDGAEYPIEDSAAPIVDDKGNTLGVVLVFHDVTDRRRTEDAIAEQREWLETTLESIGDAVIATDINSRIVFLNAVAEHLTGWGAGEAQGRDCGEVFRIVNENSRATVDSPVLRVLREGNVVGLANHTVLISRDGTEYPIDDSAAPIRGRDGRVIGVVIVFHDISERHRAEKERQQGERDREQLLQSERAARTEAERANRLKDDFVAAISHELRTPLNAILGWTQLLMNKPHDVASVARGLAVIERNTQLQAKLISDLLDLSRIMSGKLRLELQLIDLASVLDAALEAALPAAEAKRITLQRHVEDRSAKVAGDALRLQQVFTNLLTNAIKFTGEGGKVSVSLAHDDDGAHALVTVSDTGVGIKPEFMPYLFDRFRQADSSTTRRYGGLGLGLTIVKHLTELHGGSVSAHSEGQDRGATFTVRFPVGQSVRVGLPANDPPQRLRRTGAAEVRIDGIKVLVVEDDPDTREFVDRLLAEAGAHVIAVPSAAAAFDCLRRDRPDLLVSDIGLPDEDGYGLIQRIRQLPASEGGRIPAIAVTAFARTEDRRRALQSGFQSHVAKPVDPAELLASIASFAQMVRPDTIA